MIELHQENAAAMWAVRVPEARRGDGYLIAGNRVVLLRSGVRAQHVLDLAPQATLLVEDAFGVMVDRAGTLRMPVMIRRPQPLLAVDPPGVRVTEVHNRQSLAVAERVMVDGFPLPAYQPWSEGQALSTDMLAHPGWRVWLARCDGEPAAAAYTFDDGVAVGVYWLATLPAHRSRGAGRSVLTAALAAEPEKPFTLVATEAGRPLYESLGFVTAGISAWHTRPPIEA